MDYIDERNKKEKMAKSIIKRRNVIYTYRPLVKQPEEENPQKLQGTENPQNMPEAPKDEGQAQEILKRITEARPSGGKVQQEVASLLAQEEEKKQEIERILHEKDAMVEQLKSTVQRQ